MVRVWVYGCANSSTRVKLTGRGFTRVKKIMTERVARGQGDHGPEVWICKNSQTKSTCMRMKLCDLRFCLMVVSIMWWTMCGNGKVRKVFQVGIWSSWGSRSGYCTTLSRQKLPSDIPQPSISISLCAALSTLIGDGSEYVDVCILPCASTHVIAREHATTTTCTLTVV